jgi:hypothetical protein
VGEAVLGGTPRFAWGLIALAITVIVLAITAASASAATTRAEYVAQVEPICQAGVAQEEAAARPLAKKLKQLQRSRRQAHSRKAIRRFAKRELRLLVRFYDLVARVEQEVTSQIAAVPPAIEDTSLIQVWLRVRNEQAVVTQRLIRAFAKGSFFAAFDLILEATAKSAEAADLVRDFGFQYCSAPALQVVTL